MDGTSPDEILTALNPFGRVQIWFVVSCAYLQFFLPINSQSITFLGAKPDFHCSAKEGYLLNESVPLVEDESGDFVFSQCQEYTDPGKSNATQKCHNGWTYSQEYYGSTIVTEWDLVCSQDAGADTSQAIQQVGGIAGAILFGILADRIGRRPSFLLGLLLYNISGIALCFSPNFAVFAMIRFFCGFSQMAAWTPFNSSILEHMIPKYRNRAMTAAVMTTSFGLMFMSLMAFLIHDWRYLQLALVAPVVISTPQFWFLPESLRWVMSRNKEKEVERVVRLLSKINRSPLPDISKISGRNVPSSPIKLNENTPTEVLDENGTKASVQSDSRRPSQQRTESEVGPETPTPSKAKKSSYLDLFKPPILHVTVVLSITRFTFTFVYFGFALSTGRLAGNPYLNFFFSALVEVPARILPPVVYRLTRRTYLLCLCYSICGAGLIAMIFIPEYTKNGVDLRTLRTVLSLSGKFFVTLTLGGLLLLTTELYPTTLRNSGNGFTISVGRFGAVVAPLVLYLDSYVFEYFSITLMAVSSLVAAASVMTLPDTRRTSQPQTAAELKLILNSRRKESTVTLVNNAFNEDE